MRVCVFGLGEAGSTFARDLVEAGAEVSAYDPAPVETPFGVKRLPHPALAARKAEMILGLTAEPDAKLAMLQAIEIFDEGVLYADLSSCSPQTKSALQRAAELRRFEFADVALMGPVQGSGIATPAMVAGSGASRYAKIIVSMGGSADLVEGKADSTVGRNLLRSAMLKGMAAVAAETLMAASEIGEVEWVWDAMVSEMEAIDEQWLRGLMAAGRDRHSQWAEELDNAHKLLDDLGISPTMTTAASDVFRFGFELELPPAA